MAKTCNNCNTAENQNVTVPYIVHEAEVARQERQIKRMWIALIVAVALVFASNALWLWGWMQYDYSSEEITYTQDGQGTNIIGDGNNVNGAETNNSQTEAD